MAKSVFMHRSDSIYDDSPAVQYQFPRQYLGRAQLGVGDWALYLEPTKVLKTRGYFAIGRVQQIVPDPKVLNMYLALIEPGSYLEFPSPVAFNEELGLVEKGLLNDMGKLSGRAQSAIRPISEIDFNRILDLGLAERKTLLPREDVSELLPGFFAPAQTPYIDDQPRNRVQQLTSRVVRDSVFRQIVLNAYDERCAITGLKFINGGGRAEVNAAHIRPVEADGPDSVNNGLALSGTAHWMFDRGLISLGDDLEILISRHVNDQQSLRSFVKKSGFAETPTNIRSRPHPKFLEWHRNHCFKQ